MTKATLHWVSRSPFATDALELCLGVINPEDSLVLIEDAVVALQGDNPWKKRLQALSSQHAIHILGEDAALRGVTIEAPFQRVDYAGLVELACHHHNSMSWF